MPLRSAFAIALLTATMAPCQPILAELDRFSRTFTGARAAVHIVTHTEGVPDDEVDHGTFLVERKGGKVRFRIDFQPPNEYSVLVDEKNAQIYHPKLNSIDVYDLGAYKDIAQKLFLLGFGMPGRELAANYDIRSVKQDAVDGQPATYLDLVPKSPDVHKQLTRVEIWISDKTMCPTRQTFHFPAGGFRVATFSNLEVNPKFAAGAFDLPKSAKRVKAN